MLQHFQGLWSRATFSSPARQVSAAEIRCVIRGSKPVTPPTKSSIGVQLPLPSGREPVNGQEAVPTDLVAVLRLADEVPPFEWVLL